MSDAPDGPWRLFLAIPMPEIDAGRLATALAPYAAAFPAAHWQRPDAYHVTVRFLGATAPDLAPEVVDTARRCADGAGPFRMSTGPGDGVLRGAGSVAWCRIIDGKREAARISGCLMSEPGIGSRSAPPPHLSVARRVDAALIAALRSETLGPLAVEWVADRLVLYRSRTGTPAGSTYELLAEVSL